jgi:cytochrome c peroxidase
MKFYLSIVAFALLICVLQLGFQPEENITKVALGKKLFFDHILSRNYSISCASCHKPEFAFSDTAKFSRGVLGRIGKRNTPSAMNVVLVDKFFWDGRAATLEEQALAPIANPNEMDLPIDSAIGRLNRNLAYAKDFRQVFAMEPTAANLGAAIAAFERELETNGSDFDDWKFSDMQEAVSEAAKRGFQIFSTKGKCAQCHFGANHSTNEFKNIGLFDGRQLNDSGRYVVTKNPEDIGKFKTPGLRNVALTAPYMHNGMFKSLKEVIDFYNGPEKIIPNAIARDTSLARPLGLTDDEKVDLLAFLNALTDHPFKK